MSFSGDVRSIQPDAQASIVAAEVKENILPSIGSKDGEISDGEDATPFRIRVHADLSDDDDDSDNGDKHGMDGDLDHHTSWTFETRTGRQVPPISLRNDVPTVPKQDVDGDASVSTSSSINLKSTSLPHAPLDHSEEEHQRLEGELAAAQSQINEMKLQLDKSRLLEQTIRNLEAEISTLKTRPLDNSGEATPGLSPAHQPSSEVSSLERELAEERAQHEESKKLVMRLTDKYYKYKQLRSVMEQALAKVCEPTHRYNTCIHPFFQRHRIAHLWWYVVTVTNAFVYIHVLSSTAFFYSVIL